MYQKEFAYANFNSKEMTCSSCLYPYGERYEIVHPYRERYDIIRTESVPKAAGKPGAELPAVQRAIIDRLTRDGANGEYVRAVRAAANSQEQRPRAKQLPK